LLQPGDRLCCRDGRSVAVATLSGQVSIPGVSSPVKLTSEVDSRGNYTLTATHTIQLAGLTLSNAEVTLTKSGGLSLKATWDYAGITFNVTGTATANGYIDLQGTAKATKLPSGFTLGDISAKVELNRPANSYMLNIKGTADVLVANGTFEAKANWDGKGTPTTALTLTAQVGGALAVLFSGNATFTIESGAVSFSGRLDVKNLPNVSVNVSGSVKFDGTLTIGGYTTKASDLINRNPREIAKTLVGIGISNRDVALALWNMIGNRLAVFDAIAFGLGRGLVDGIRVLVSLPGNVLKNSAFEVAKFLLNEAGRGLGDTARTISDWLGGDRVSAFWAIVHPNAANRSYADGIRGLIGANLLTNNYNTVFDFLRSQLNFSTALSVMRQLF